MAIVNGFALLRNGVRYDYPFIESLQSLKAATNSITLALGDSDDDTEAQIRNSGIGCDIVHTKWDESMRKGGAILSQQTNIALESLRERLSRKGWGLYLQSDEVFSDREIKLIQHDIDEADKMGCDAVRFRYLHFWQSFDSIAIGRRWYPHEIRAIRLDSDIRSYGDAQSFEGASKVFDSEATVFHYGHVREKSAYEKKKTDFHRWWHTDDEIEKVLIRSQKNDVNEKTIPYLGPHPTFMNGRIGRQASPAPNRRVSIFTGGKAIPEGFVEKIEAGSVEILNRFGELKGRNPADCIICQNLNFTQRLLTFFRYDSRVPSKMESPQARAWGEEFRLVLKLSEKGVGFDRFSRN